MNIPSQNEDDLCKMTFLTNQLKNKVYLFSLFTLSTCVIFNKCSEHVVLRYKVFYF